MHKRISGREVGQFKTVEALNGIDSRVAANVIATASDLALIIDGKGVICDVAVGNTDLGPDFSDGWIGQRWSEIVTVESKNKVREILKDAGTKTRPSRWRELNHPSAQGADVPMRYAAIQLGDKGKILALGRDQRAIASLQQKLVHAQLSVEREYARLREAETRYRLLFQLCSEAVLVVDPATTKVLEVNPALSALTGLESSKIVGTQLLRLFDKKSAKLVRGALTAAEAVGRAGGIEASLGVDQTQITLHLSLFRQGTQSYILVRLVPLRETTEDVEADRQKSLLLQSVEKLPDALVLVDDGYQVLDANPAFLSLVECSTLKHVRGRSMENWFERAGVDFKVLQDNLASHSAVRRFATIIRGEYGTATEVELSAVRTEINGAAYSAFVMRTMGLRRTPEKALEGSLPRSVEQLTDLIGHVSLKDVVREATDVIERLCIEAALELTGDNRASAAQMLGLSRQSLYAKLRRYGLGDLDAENDV